MGVPTARSYHVAVWTGNEMIVWGGSGYSGLGSEPPVNTGARYEVCGAPSECSTGYCVDGVCCESECGGGAADDCQACSRASGAAIDGTCGPIDDGASCDDIGGLPDGGPSNEDPTDGDMLANNGDRDGYVGGTPVSSRGCGCTQPSETRPLGLWLFFVGVTVWRRCLSRC